MPNKNSQEPMKLWYEYIWLTIGVLLVAAGVYFFKFPNNYSIGGVTGLAILFSKITNGALSSGTIVLWVNMVLLVLGYFVLGKGAGFKTAYGSILLSASLKILEIIYPMNAPFTTEPLLELFFAVLLPAVGAAILFNLGGSTGGTDIIAMILKKYTNTDIGKALFSTDLLLTLATFPLFGIQTGLLSLTGLIIKSAVIDNMIESMNLCKYFTIVCDDPKPICCYITKTLNRSATIFDAKGAFSDHEKKIILTVMSRVEAIKLQRYIKQSEPNAFILITNTSEIIGRGFRA